MAFSFYYRVLDSKNKVVLFQKMRWVWDPAAFFIRESGSRERAVAPPTGRFVRTCVPKRQFGEKPGIVARILVFHKYGRGILKGK